MKTRKHLEALCDGLSHQLLTRQYQTFCRAKAEGVEALIRYILEMTEPPELYTGSLRQQLFLSRWPYVSYEPRMTKNRNRPSMIRNHHDL